MGIYKTKLYIPLLVPPQVRLMIRSMKLYSFEFINVSPQVHVCCLHYLKHDGCLFHFSFSTGQWRALVMLTRHLEVSGHMSSCVASA